jgi:hypothetical protein
MNKHLIVIGAVQESYRNHNHVSNWINSMSMMGLSYIIVYYDSPSDKFKEYYNVLVDLSCKYVILFDLYYIIPNIRIQSICHAHGISVENFIIQTFLSHKKYITTAVSLNNDGSLPAACPKMIMGYKEHLINMFDRIGESLLAGNRSFNSINDQYLMKNYALFNKKKVHIDINRSIFNICSNKMADEQHMMATVFNYFEDDKLYNKFIRDNFNPKICMGGVNDNLNYQAD